MVIIKKKFVEKMKNRIFFEKEGGGGGEGNKNFPLANVKNE